jgi:hypothetical protein
MKVVTLVISVNLDINQVIMLQFHR